MPHCATGYIIDLWSDNTSANSWLRLAAKVSDPAIRRLARVASTMLVCASTYTARFQALHIPGVENVEADLLSRLKNGYVPGWDYVTATCSQLRNCRICLLPPELLSTLADVLSSSRIEGTYDELTTRLLTLELVILEDGLSDNELVSTLQ